MASVIKYARKLNDLHDLAWDASYRLDPEMRRVQAWAVHGHAPERMRQLIGA